jgi:hypothetical protein
MDLTKLPVETLKNAIWHLNIGMVPIGGLPIEHYREELKRRGEVPIGYHEKLKLVK